MQAQRSKPTSWTRPARITALTVVVVMVLGVLAAPFAWADTVGPEVTVSNPPAVGATIDSPVTITGTVTDNEAVGDVLVAVKDRDTNLWWDADSESWGSFTRTAATLDSGGTSSDWSWPFTGAAPGGAYWLSVKSTDAAGNPEQEVAGLRFNVSPTVAEDTTGPQLTVTSPQSGEVVEAPVTITGGVTDDVAVGEVAVAIKDRGTNQWWDPDSESWGSFTRAAATLDSSGTSSDWSLPFTGASEGDSYWLSVKSTDAAGNPEQAKIGWRFDVTEAAPPDTTGPQITVSTPPSGGAVVEAPVSVVGQVTDDVALGSSVSVAVKDRNSNDWWDPETEQWGSFTRTDVPLDSPGGTSSDFSWPFTGAADGGEYWLSVKATDAAGNPEQAKIGRQFDVANEVGAHYVGDLLGAGVADMYPVDLAANPSGTTLYVVDPGRYRLVSVNIASGQEQGQFGSVKGSGNSKLSAARGVDVASSGDVYVADSANNRVVVLDSALQFDSAFGTNGTNPGQFKTVWDVAVGPGVLPGGGQGEVVYTTDGSRVQKHNLAGTTSVVFATGFNNPRQLAVNPVTRDLYVVNARDREVVVFNQNGGEKFRFGSQGSGPGQFSGDPRGIAFSSDGSVVWVSDAGNARIHSFNAATGAHLSTIDDDITEVRGLDVVGDSLFASDEWAYSILEFDTDAPSQPLVRSLFGGGPPTNGVNSPRGIDVGPNGVVYTTDWWNQRIVAKSAQSTFAWGERGRRPELGTLNFPWALAVQDSTGRVFVANRESHEIEVYEADGTSVTHWGQRGSGIGDFQFPNNLAFAPDGTLWVSDSGNDRIQRFAIDAGGNGAFLGAYGSAGTGLGKFTNAVGIDITPDGRVWVADQNNNRIQVLTPSTGSWQNIGSPYGDLPFRPLGITVAPDGTVFVTDAARDQVLQLSSNGTLLWSSDGQSLGAGALNDPFDVAFASNGRMYVSDLWNNRVISVDGVFS